MPPVYNAGFVSNILSLKKITLMSSSEVIFSDVRKFLQTYNRVLLTMMGM